MEFLNIGGGELLVIVLLAIILFGPEDILRIMRTIGNYTRKIQRMWTQVSSGLKGEFIPDEILPEEIRETIKETKTSVDDVKATLEEVQTTVQTDIDETKATVEEVKDTLKDVDSTVKSDMREIPRAMRETAKEAITPKEKTRPTVNKPGPESVQLITALLDDDSGSAGNAQVNEETAMATAAATPAEGTAAAETAPTETSPASSASDEAAAGSGTNAPEPPGDTVVQQQSPTGARTVDEEPDPRTLAVIAELLAGKSRDTGDKAHPLDDETAPRDTADILENDLPQGGMDALQPANVDTTSSADPLPTATTIQDEEV